MKIPTPRKLPSGSWFVQLRLGGESIPITAATEKECRYQAQLIKAEHVAGRRRRAWSELTLREVCQAYIARKEKAGASPETVRGYDIIMRNRFQGLMDQPVSLALDWQKAYNADAKHLSPKTMKNTWGFIRTAVRSELGLELPDVTQVAAARTEHSAAAGHPVKLIRIPDLFMPQNCLAFFTKNIQVLQLRCFPGFPGRPVSQRSHTGIAHNKQALQF